MPQPSIADLAERFEHLERECRDLRRQALRWRRTGLAAVAGVALLAFAGAQRAEDRRLAVSELVVQDKAGKPRIVMKVDAQGSPYLMLKDKDGADRYGVGLGGGPGPEENPYMNFNAKGGQGGLLIGVGGGPGPEQNPYMNFRSKDGVGRLLMGLGGGPEPTEDPYLTMRDKNDKQVFKAP